MRSNTQARLLCAAFAAVVIATAGCGGQSETGSDTLKIGAFSVVREAFHDGLLPAFAAQRKAKTGRDVRFEESYQASGTQARAIATGFDVDIAILSHSGDMSELVKAGRVASNWVEQPHAGIVATSIVVIGHREGNPKEIKDWTDLAKPGVGVLYADPKTSGGARWNINAIYGSALLDARKKSAEPDLAPVRDILARVQANVVNMDASGRQSMANFAERGIGDAVITYENEILLSKKSGKPIPYVVPPATLRIESPGALVDTSVERHGNRELAQAFLDFLRSPEGQTILAEYGFRPVDPTAEIKDLPQPETLFTMNDIGGWQQVQDAVYGPKGIWTNIFNTTAEAR
jgi:sulfate/thiosulfate-binding protein